MSATIILMNHKMNGAKFREWNDLFLIMGECVNGKFKPYGANENATLTFEGVMAEMQRENRFVVGSMFSVMLGGIPVSISEIDFDPSDTMTVVTNETKRYGAVAICLPELQRKLAEVYGEDYYILPSSKHEVITIPVSQYDNPEELMNIVREINASIVSEEDFLSDSVYKYADGLVVKVV